MNAFEGLISRVNAVSESLERGSLIQDTFIGWGGISERMEDMQRDQLMGGLRSDGEQIQPFFSQDPYFRDKGIKAMRAYADRKMRNFPDPRRGYDTPNLFISGYFHNGFHVVFGLDEIYMDNYNKNVADRRGRTQNLYEKYGADTFGLTDENWEEILFDFKPRLADKIRERL